MTSVDNMTRGMGAQASATAAVTTAGGKGACETRATTRSWREIERSERIVIAWLSAWSLFFLVFHLAIGFDELHRSHLLLGRHLLFGEPAPNPAHPMFGYAIVMAALGSWTPILSAAVGWSAFVLALRWLDLGRAPPSPLFLAAIVAYAGMVTSWNDHALWLGLILLALAIFHRFADRGAVAGAVIGLAWGLAYNIRPEALLLFPLFLMIELGLEAMGQWPSRLKCHVAAAAVFALSMVPWALYTTATLGKYTPSTTHGWSVAYYSLGLVPDNKYGIVPQDEWLFARAAEIGERTPWSDRANEHFREEFMRIVSSDPGYFMRRIGWGLDTFIRGGPYVPDFRLLVGRDPAEQERLRYAARKVVEDMGFPRWLLSSSMQRLPDEEHPTSTLFEKLLVFGFIPLAIVLRLALVVALAQTAWVLLRPWTVLRYGPVLAMALSTIGLTLFVVAVFLPTSRASTVPLVFAAIFLQALRCGRRARLTRDGRPSSLTDT